MLPPVLFPLITWLGLLIRYPKRTLAIAVPVFSVIVLIAGWVQWQELRTNKLLAQLHIELDYSLAHCPADQPLRAQIKNPTPHAVQNLRWRIAGSRPGESTNLVENRYDIPSYQGPALINAGEQWSHCFPAPTVRRGYRASTLEFKAEHLQGTFAR